MSRTLVKLKETIQAWYDWKHRWNPNEAVTSRAVLDP